MEPAEECSLQLRALDSDPEPPGWHVSALAPPLPGRPRISPFTSPSLPSLVYKWNPNGPPSSDVVSLNEIL